MIGVALGVLVANWLFLPIFGKIEYKRERSRGANKAAAKKKSDPYFPWDNHTNGFCVGVIAALLFILFMSW